MAVPAGRPRSLVIKIGGSLASNDQLIPWLTALEWGCAATSPQQSRCVVVPGGGTFADAVRKTQLQFRFDDETAHHMALLAMEQFGLTLAALWPQLVRTETPSGIRRAWRIRRIACWAPTRMVLAAAAPAKSWKMTSDSLAAWLAGVLGAKRLLLIKSVDVAAQPGLAADLIASGLVDPLFGHFAAASGADVFIAGPAALADAGAVLARGDTPGARVQFSSDFMRAET